MIDKKKKQAEEGIQPMRARRRVADAKLDKPTERRVLLVETDGGAGRNKADAPLCALEKICLI